MVHAPEQAEHEVSPDLTSAGRPVASAAWVESPLQLLGAIEAFHAGMLGPEALVLPRRDVPGMPSAVGVVRGLRLPSGLEVAAPDEALPAFGPHRTAWAAGDIYSGLVQSAVLAPTRAEHVVLLDDGLATMRALGQLTSSRPVPMTRQRGSRSPARVALSLAVRTRLRSLARSGRLTVFTALPVADDVAARFERMGGSLVRHRFEWLATQPVTEKITARTVVVGSALPADGLIRPESYVRWLHSLAEHEKISYFPHRRTDPGVIAALGAHRRIRVEANTLPIEMRLRHLGPGQRVVCLPSTALVTLRLVLAGTGADLQGMPIPLPWWTDRAGQSLRTHLSSVLADLENV